MSLDDATSLDDFRGHPPACVVETAPGCYLLCWTHVAEVTYADRPRLYLAASAQAAAAADQAAIYERCAVVCDEFAAAAEATIKGASLSRVGRLMQDAMFSMAASCAAAIRALAAR